MTWRPETERDLLAVNNRLMAFRALVEPARNKRIAHVDLMSQIGKVGPLGGFPAGADEEFFEDLGNLLNIAYHELTGGAFLLSIGGSTDTHNLIRALVKARLYDECERCTELDRINAVLNTEQTF